MWKGSLRDIPTENHHPTPQLQLVTFSSVFWFYCWQLHCLVPSSSSTLFPDSRQLFWAKKKSSKNTLHTTCSADGKVSWLVKTQILCLTSWWSPDLSLNESEYWTYILQARSPETSGYRGTPVLWIICLVSHGGVRSYFYISSLQMGWCCIISSFKNTNLAQGALQSVHHTMPSTLRPLATHHSR